MSDNKLQGRGGQQRSASKLQLINRGKEMRRSQKGTAHGHLNLSPSPAEGVDVAGADSTGLDGDVNVVRTGRLERVLDDLEVLPVVGVDLGGKRTTGEEQRRRRSQRRCEQDGHVDTRPSAAAPSLSLPCLPHTVSLPFSLKGGTGVGERQAQVRRER